MRCFRDLLGAAATTPIPPNPENFVLKRLKDADALTRDVTSVFFGLNIACAQCHRHPEIKSLTQDYFFGMKAFFSYSYDFQGQLLERQFVKLADFKAKNGETRKAALLFLSGTKVDIDSLPDGDLNKAMQEESKVIQEAAKTYAKSKNYCRRPPNSGPGLAWRKSRSTAQIGRCSPGPSSIVCGFVSTGTAWSCASIRCTPTMKPAIRSCCNG